MKFPNSDGSVDTHILTELTVGQLDGLGGTSRTSGSRVIHHGRGDRVSAILRIIIESENKQKKRSYSKMLQIQAKLDGKKQSQVTQIVVTNLDDKTVEEAITYLTELTDNVSLGGLTKDEAKKEKLEWETAHNINQKKRSVPKRAPSTDDGAKRRRGSDAAAGQQNDDDVEEEEDTEEAVNKKPAAASPSVGKKPAAATTQSRDLSTPTKSKQDRWTLQPNSINFGDGLTTHKVTKC